MQDNPSDSPTDHQQQDIDRPQSSSSRSSRRINPSASANNPSTNNLNQPSTDPLSQSSQTSSRISATIPHTGEPIANRTRGALRASFGGAEINETASSASAGSRFLDQNLAQAESSESSRRVTRSAFKRRVSELGTSGDLDDNQPRAGPSASSRNKGKQKAPDPESEEEEQESESGKGPPARKRVKRESAASKPKQEETQSSGKSRMSGKGKPRGASKKQPKPPKRERVMSGSGNSRRNRGGDNDLSPYEDEDVDMEDPAPPVSRRRKSSNKQIKSHEVGLAAAASGSSSALRTDPERKQHEGMADDDEDEGMESDEEKPSEDVLAAATAGGSVGNPPPVNTGSTSAISARATTAAAAAAMLEAAGQSSIFSGMYGFGGGGGGGGLATKWREMISNLKSADPTVRLAALEQASMELAMAMEEMLAGRFPTEAAVKEFVAILDRKPNVDNKTAATAPQANDSPSDEDEDDDEDAELRRVLKMSRDGAGNQAGESDDEADIQADLYACRCLSNLMEVLPGSVAVIVHAGAVPVLCKKLQSIQFIELGAQVISTLEKIAREQPATVVRAGGMQALLEFLDFFDKYDQRTAVTAVSNCCKRISSDNFHHVKAIFSKLRDILAFPEQKMVEAACVSIIRIIDSFKLRPDLLEQLLDKEAVFAINILLMPSGGPQTLPANVFTDLLKALSVAAKASAKVTLAFIEADLPASTYFILTGVLPPAIMEEHGAVSAAPPSETAILQNIGQRPKGHVEEALVLLNELLPPLPKDGVFEPRNYSERMLAKYVKAKSRVDRDKSKNPSGPVQSLEDIVQASSHSSATPTTSSGTPSEASVAAALSLTVDQVASINKAKKDAESASQAKAEVFQKNSASVGRLIQIVVPVLVSVYSAAPAVTIRSKALSGLLRALSFGDADLLRAALKTIPLASLLSTIITSQENDSITLAMLQMIEILLDKMPEVYMRSFHREGIFQGICALADQELSPAAMKRAREVSEKRSKLEDQHGIVDSSAGTPAPEADISNPNVASDTSPEPTNGVLDRAIEKIAAAGGDRLVSDAVERKPDPATLLAIDKAGNLMARKISSVPTDPHDVNIVRCRLLRIKKNLDAIEQEVAEDSGSIQAIKELCSILRDQDTLEDALVKTCTEIASMFVDGTEPLSSYELLHTGLLDCLMAFISEEGKVSVADRRRIIYKQLTAARPGRAETPFVELVKRLQESLSKSEKFEVEVPLSSSRGLGRSAGESPLDNVVRTMRVRLLAEADADIPKLYKDIIVAVAAISPVAQVNSYVRRSMSSGGPGGRSGLGGSFYESLLSGAEGLRERLEGASSRVNPAGDPAGAAAGENKQLQPEAGTPAPSSAPNPLTQPPNTLVERRSSARLRGKDPQASVEGIATESSAIEGSGVSLDSVLPENGERVANLEERMEKEEQQIIFGEEDEMDDGYDEDDYDEDGEAVYDDEMMDDEGMDRLAEKTVELKMPEAGSAQLTTPDGTRVPTPSGTVPAAEASRPADGLPKAGSYAAALRAPPQDWHLEFSINGQTLSYGETMYGAISRTRSNKDPKVSIWDTQVVVKFKKVTGPAPVSPALALAPEAMEPASVAALPDSLATEGATATALRMLRVLHAVNQDHEDARDGNTQVAVNQAAFVNPKLTAKFVRQLEELVVIVSNTMPGWAVDLPTFFPFLFPFEARFAYLQSTSFGYSRLMHRWMAAQPPASNEQRRHTIADFLPRMTRCKVRIGRANILQSALRVLELYGPTPGILEIEYFDEVGTGLGPTLEFYTMVSRAFAGKALDMWRDTDSSGAGEHVMHPNGLFPSPMPDEASENSTKERSPLSLFNTLGIFAGKGLLDSRILDLNFNKVFMRAVLGQPVPITIETLTLVDPGLARSLEKLQEMVDAKSRTKNDPNATMSTDVTGIADLQLDFTVPGYPEVVMKPDGAQTDVTDENVEEYIALVLDYTLKRGIARQVEAFQQGFSKIFPVSHLAVFGASELVLLFGDPDEDWSKETLQKSIKADHGYTSESQQVRDLLDVMCDFKPEERRAFLQFATGAPKLPIGGFKSLNPQFTIVRKPHEPPYQADHYLPSVMTCAQYLKLPQYSSKEVLRRQVVTAMHEGAGAFLLS